MNHINNPEMFERRLADLFQVLRKRAEVCAPAPKGPEIAEMFGLASTTNTKRYFDRLQERGLIHVETLASTRVVTILGTGERTKRTEGQLAGAARPGGRHRPPGNWHSPDYDSPERIAERLAAREAEAVRIAALIPADRTPCPVCGVRGDVIHSHRRRA